jgi:tetratricopeptide (TPR) repeat protein
MFGQMLLAAKNYRLALELYRKLRNCSHTHKDIIIKMFAYKQMGHCFAKLEKYENALICFKFMLALAWATKSTEAELTAYEGLAIMNLYLGKI